MSQEDTKNLIIAYLVRTYGEQQANGDFKIEIPHFDLESIPNIGIVKIVNDPGLRTAVVTYSEGPEWSEDRKRVQAREVSRKQIT